MYCLGWAGYSKRLHETPGELPRPKVELAALTFLSNGKAIKSVLWAELGLPTPAMTTSPPPSSASLAQSFLFPCCCGLQGKDVW